MSINTLAFGAFGWQEILIVLAVVLLLFGGRKLPELAKGLGRGLRLFKREFHEERDDDIVDSEVDETKSLPKKDEESAAKDAPCRDQK